MNSKVIIGLVAVVVIVGGVWLVMRGGSSNKVPANTTTNTTDTTNTATSNTSSGSGTFASMMGMSGSYKCTVSSKDPNALSNGMVYISSGNMRSDFTSMSGGRSIDVHMIKNGSDIYTWTSAYPQGMKMSVSMMTNPQAGAASGQGFNPNVSVDYSCEPAVADAGMFVAPSDITFMTLPGVK